MMTRGTMRTLASATYVTILTLLALAVASCGEQATGTTPAPSATFPAAVETPIAQAQEADISPYWLGDSVTISGHALIWAREADYGDLGNELPSVGFSYAEPGGLTGSLFVRTFPPTETLEYRRGLALEQLGAVRGRAEIPGWSGDVIWNVDDRGQLHVSVFLYSEAAAMAIGTAPTELTAGGPFGEVDTVVQIIEENLRPFPE
jgi:hypothetical protein